MGKMRMGTMKVKMPGHPTLRQMIIVPPIRPKGNIIPANINGSLVSIELKSLLSKLMSLPNYADFAAKDVNLEILAYISSIMPARMRQEMIGME